MRKKLKTGMIAATLALSMSVTAFAGQWTQDSIGWHYDKTGSGNFAVNEWVWIDSDNDGVAECYCFDATSFLYTNTTTPDGHTVNENGAWVVNGQVQTQGTAAKVSVQSSIDVAGYYWPSSLKVNTTGETEQFEYNDFTVGNFILEPQADGNMKATYPNNEVDGMPTYVFTKTGEHTYQRSDSIGRPVILTVVDAQTVTITESDGLFTYTYQKRQ